MFKKKNKTEVVTDTVKETEVELGELDFTPEEEFIETEPTAENEPVENSVIEEAVPATEETFDEPIEESFEENVESDTEATSEEAEENPSEPQIEEKAVKPVKEKKVKAPKAPPKEGSTEYTVRMIVILAAICTGIALLLSVVNMLTEDVIAENSVKAQNEAVLSIFPDGDAVQEYTNEDGENIFVVLKNGEIIGCCVNSVGSGYGGDIELMVGINTDGKISGMSFLSMSETPGVGTKVKGEGFVSQLIGLNEKAVIGENVDGISGASFSSAGVVEAINNALDIEIDLDAIADSVGGKVSYGDDEDKHDANRENGDSSIGVDEIGENEESTETVTDPVESEPVETEPEEIIPEPEPIETEPDVVEPTVEPDIPVIVEPEPQPQPEPETEPTVVEPEPQPVEPEPVEPEPVEPEQVETEPAVVEPEPQPEPIETEPETEEEAAPIPVEREDDVTDSEIEPEEPTEPEVEPDEPTEPTEEPDNGEFNEEDPFEEETEEEETEAETKKPWVKP